MAAIAITLGVLLLAAGALAAWLHADRRRLSGLLAERDGALASREAELARHSAAHEDKAARLIELNANIARLEERIAASERARAEQAAIGEQMDKRLRDAFGSLAAEALKGNNEQFLALARKAFQVDSEKATGDLEARRKAVEEMVKPIRERLAAIEKAGAENAATFAEQVRSLRESNLLLGSRTQDLVAALRKPQVRGAYGEMILERVVELSGMRPYCHFSTQDSRRDAEGDLLRPDMVVSLPNGRTVVIDAKTNIEAYLDAVHAKSPEEADAHLDRFARHVADQAEKLSKKDYAGVVEGSAEFVVMFIPGDQFIDAALQRRPDLLDLAAQRSVILASPSTLIGLLRAVHIGWREKQLSDSAKELFELGKSLHERVATAMDLASGIGESIQRAQAAWNKFVGSVTSRLLPAVAKFEQAGARSSKSIEEPKVIEGETREPPLIETRVDRAALPDTASA